MRALSFRQTLRPDRAAEAISSATSAASPGGALRRMRAAENYGGLRAPGRAQKLAWEAFFQNDAQRIKKMKPGTRTTAPRSNAN